MPFNPPGTRNAKPTRVFKRRPRRSLRSPASTASPEAQRIWARAGAAAAAAGAGGAAGGERQLARPSVAMSAPARAPVRRDRLGTTPAAYLRQLLDPWDRSSNYARYPDESVAATAMTTFISTSTLTCAGTGAVYADLTQKCVPPASYSVSASNYPLSGPGSRPAFVAQVPGTLAVQGYTGAGASPPVDYGGAVTTWAGTPGAYLGSVTATGLSANDRTLAWGMRVRITSPPPNTFGQPGRFYFLQLPANMRYTAVSQFTANEGLCAQAVTSRLGFSLTAKEVWCAPSGVRHAGLPSGPNSFLFSDTNSLLNTIAGAGTSNASSANTASSTGDAGSSQFSASPFLAVIAFGLPADTVVQFDYAHIVEYTPTAGAVGLIAISNELPDVSARQSITAAAQRYDSRVMGATSIDDSAASVTRPVMEVVGAMLTGAAMVAPTPYSIPMAAAGAGLTAGAKFV